MNDLLFNKYAPIVIPTLNRFEHFKKCLESLEHCTGAEKTDVYIALDYPAKPSHEEGYRKISEYLNSLESNHGFKTLNIIRREYNYGVGPHGNGEELVKMILETYDRIIFSEDDNIFSPNFIVFINKGLEKFENDKSVLAINGYTHCTSIKYGKNNHFRQNVGFSAWGYGIWKDRVVKYKEEINTRFFVKILLNPFALWRIKRNGYNKLISYFSLLLDWNGLFIDSVLNIYMAVKKVDVIMPVLSMVRNCGWDGTGEHCQTDNKMLIEKFSSSRIDDAIDFEYKGDSYSFYKDNQKILVANGATKIGLGQFTIQLGKLLIKRIIK